MTIKLYSGHGSVGSRKAKAWLAERGIHYQERNLSKVELSTDEIKELFRLSDDIYDVLSKRSTTLQNYPGNIEDLTFNELISFVQQNPDGLKRPLIHNGKVFVSGFDDDKMSVFRSRR